MKQIGQFTNFIGTESGVYSMGSPGVEQTASGNPITIQSAAAPFTELLIFGKTTQLTTTGAQLLDPSIFPDLTKLNDVTITNNKDGSFTATGEKTETGVVNLIAVKPVLLTAGKYVMSGSVSPLVMVASYGDPITYRTGNITLDLDMDYEVTFYIQVDNSFSSGEQTFYPMLNAGSTALPFEPYTGGKPSPSPEYKQDTTNAGSSGQVNVDVGGGNLFDVSNVNVLNMYIANSGIGNWPSNWCVVIPIKPNTEYAISEKNQKTIRYAVTSEFPYDGIEALEKDITSVYKNLFVSGNISEAKYLLIQLYGDFATQPDFSGIMVNEGSTVLPYQPYVTPQSLVVSTPNGLPGVPTTGEEYTYIDADGQKWIADSVEYFSDGTGRYVQRNDKQIFDGGDDERWIKAGTANRFFIALKNPLKSLKGALCDQFMFKNSVNIGSNTFYINVDGNILFTTEFETVEEWKGYLQTNPVTVLYPLATPIITPLSAEQVAEFKALTTYEPTTVIQNDAGCWMQVGYYSGPAIQRLVIDAQKINRY